MSSPELLIYDVVFPINSTAQVRTDKADIGTVTVRIEFPGGEEIKWSEIEKLAAPYAQNKVVNMVAPGGGIGPGEVKGVMRGSEKRPKEAWPIPEREGVFIWDVTVHRNIN